MCDHRCNPYCTADYLGCPFFERKYHPNWPVVTHDGADQGRPKSAPAGPPMGSAEGVQQTGESQVLDGVQKVA